MMFDMSKIKRFKLEDLVGRTVTIREFRDSGYVLTSAIDVESGDLFVLSQHQEVMPEAPLMGLPDTCPIASNPNSSAGGEAQSLGLRGKDLSILS